MNGNTHHFLPFLLQAPTHDRRRCPRRNRLDLVTNGSSNVPSVYGCILAPLLGNKRIKHATRKDRLFCSSEPNNSGSSLGSTGSWYHTKLDLVERETLDFRVLPGTNLWKSHLGYIACWDNVRSCR
jgi:hypothetical protein